MAQTRRRGLSTLIAFTALAAGLVHPTQAHTGRAAQPEVRAAGGGPCPTTAQALLAVPLHRLRPGAQRYTVQVQQRSAQGRVQLLYRAFTVVEGPLAVPSLAVSGDGRWLSYSDGQFRLHLVSLPRGQDRIIGRGMMPQFSYDGRFVAFLSGRILPLSSPGPQAEHLLLYNLHSATLARVGPPHGSLLNSFAWAPHDDRLAWQISRDTGPLMVGLATAAHPTLVRTLALPAKARTDAGVAWSADGQSLLYWHVVSVTPLGPAYALMQRRLPAGPATTAVAPSPTSWSEGAPPPPVPAPRAGRIASLLGGPHGGLDQVILYTPGRRSAQHVLLPGEPRLLAFAPTGAQALVVWDALRSDAVVRHAALLSGTTGQVQDLRPAVAAFWIHKACAGSGSGGNGPLVALSSSGGLGGAGEIFAVQRGRVLRVLVRGLPFPAMSGLAASPRGRGVAFSEAATIAPGHPPRTQGLWLVPGAGGRPRRLLLPPRSVEGNQLGIGPVAWSPDGSTLAYAVNPGGGVMNASRPEPALGIWLTRYDYVHPHLLVTFAQLGAVDAPPSRAPFAINQLSWASDGRTLAVSTFRRMPGAPQPGQTIPVILVVNTTTGAVRLLVRGGQDGVLVPTGSALAYTTGRRGAATLWVTDAHGRHSRVLVRGPISSPAWAPDGRAIAYVDGGTAIRTVAVASGQTRAVLNGRTQGLFPAGGGFLRLAWMQARVRAGAARIAPAAVGAGPVARPVVATIRPERPGALAVGPRGQLYIADDGRNQILELVPGDSFKVVAGTGKAGFSGDIAAWYIMDTIAIRPDRKFKVRLH